MCLINTLLLIGLSSTSFVVSHEIDGQDNVTPTISTSSSIGAITPTSSQDDQNQAVVLVTPLKIKIDKIPFPDDIYTELIKTTIGQDQAMRQMASFVHEHLVNLKMRNCLQTDKRFAEYKDLDLTKPNILMVGPTGTGKTSTLKILSKYLKVPIVIGNATEWTTQGYIGSKWQYMFDILYSNAETLLRSQGNKKPKNTEILACAQQGIVFMDELDKICLDTSSNLEVVSRVQQELLPPIQGTKIVLNNGEVLDTSSILFIGGGAFSRLKPQSGSSITPHDLEQYGMLPELAGRLGNIVQLNPLSKASLKQIMLLSSGSALRQIQLRFKAAYGVHLTFDEEALDYIAEVASKQNTGARSLNAMITKIMQDKSFNIKNYLEKPIHITRLDAEKELKNFVPQKVEINPSIAHLYT